MTAPGRVKRVASILSFNWAQRGSEGETVSTRPPRLREKAQVLDETALDRALTRIAHEILERNGGAKDLALRRPPHARRDPGPAAHRQDRRASTATTLPVGTLDITLYRDDLDMRGAR